MEENTQDTFARAYATLSSLRNNVSQMTSNVPETYVHEFHSVLNRLEGIGRDVSEYRITDSEIAPRVISISTLTFRNGPKAGTSYSKEKYVDKHLILYKLDAILSYFEIITAKPPREIGFRTPDKQ